MNEPRFRYRIPEIAEEVERMRKRQQERDGPTGYEDATPEELLFDYRHAAPELQPRDYRNLTRELISRMTK